MMRGALAALRQLREGNQRFVDDLAGRGQVMHGERRAELVARQEPFAIVLGCSDSRVPLEIVFDQGLGDLFVIRVAGNIVAPSLVGSVEFAAQRFGTRLVVVLGHSQCGAVAATLEELERPSSERSPNLSSIVDRIRPAVETLFETDLRHDKDELNRRAVRAKILEDLIISDGLLIVGAEYSLETGVVEFFESPTDPG
jgi:carbonic anhydrase